MWHEAVNRRFQDDADDLLVGPGVDHQEDSPEGFDAGDQEKLLGMMIRVWHRAGQVAVEDLTASAKSTPWLHRFARRLVSSH